MKNPWTVKLMILLYFIAVLFSAFFGYDLALPLFVVLLLSTILAEIKFKYGNLSRKSVLSFLYTPIIYTSLVAGEVKDDSPKFSFLKGISLILSGTVVVIVILITVFALIS